MTRMTKAQEARREELENVLAKLARARVLLRSQVSLRLQQGILRNEYMGDLLRPAVDQLGQIEAAVECARELLGKYWKEGNRAGWQHTEKKSVAE